MGLKELYDDWTFRPIIAGEGKTPREQTDGKVAVDFLPNTYQTQVTNRAPDDKTVVLATGDDETEGSFNETALTYYSTLLNTYSRVAQTYKAQKEVTNTFVGSTDWSGSPGVLYSTNS